MKDIEAIRRILIYLAIIIGIPHLIISYVIPYTDIEPLGLLERRLLTGFYCLLSVLTVHFSLENTEEAEWYSAFFATVFIMVFFLIVPVPEVATKIYGDSFPKYLSFTAASGLIYGYLRR